MADSTKASKPLIAARERGPGPGRYALPSTLGSVNRDPTKNSSPAYRFGIRLNNAMFRKDGSPGPGYFVDPTISRFGRDGNPSYSILGRQKDPNSFNSPSPGAYYPEQVHPQGEKHAPVYSMGARTRYRKRDATPSPNSYTLPSLLGSKVPNKMASSAYSMAGRPVTGSFSEDLAKTPGPGRYDQTVGDVYCRKAPNYSMLGRRTKGGDAHYNPGPGAYCPEKVHVNKRSAPTFSLGIRHSEFMTPLIVEVPGE